MQARAFLLEQLATWQLGPKPSKVGLIQRQDLAGAAVVLDVLEDPRLHELMAELLVRPATSWLSMVLSAPHATLDMLCSRWMPLDTVPLWYW